MAKYAIIVRNKIDGIEQMTSYTSAVMFVRACANLKSLCKRGSGLETRISEAEETDEGITVYADIVYATKN